ncbi:Formyltransferase [Martensiomyces pterosporus]|nr:Formyltransferase [Martensiomyces pterosporus]
MAMALLECTAQAVLGARSALRLGSQRTHVHSIYTRAFSTSKQSEGLKVLFFGTDKFSDHALKALDSDRCGNKPVVDAVEVVCPPPAYRFKKDKMILAWEAEVEKTAREKELKIHHPPGRSMTSWSVPELEGDFKGEKFDIGVVSSFGQFLPRRIIESFPLGMINIHPSLLPQYRGPSPLQAALLNGDRTTGLTIQEVHPKVMDGGKVLAQIPFTIEDSFTRDDLVRDLGHLSGQLLLRVLHNLEVVRREAITQDESKVTTTRLYSRADSKVIWENMSAEEIVRIHKAFYGMEPVHSIWRWRSKMHGVQLLEMDLAPPDSAPLVDDYLKYPPGTLFFARKVPYIEVPCLGGGRLHVTLLKVEGKTEKSAREFANGYLRKTGALRFLTDPVEPKKPTPAFVYPPGHEPPAAIGHKLEPSEGQRVEEDEGGFGSDAETAVDSSSEAEQKPK